MLFSACIASMSMFSVENLTIYIAVVVYHNVQCLPCMQHVATWNCRVNSIFADAFWVSHAKVSCLHTWSCSCAPPKPIMWHVCLLFNETINESVNESIRLSTDYAIEEALNTYLTLTQQHIKEQSKPVVDKSLAQTACTFVTYGKTRSLANLKRAQMWKQL